MPRTVEAGTSGQLQKKIKNWGNFEQSVGFSLNFRKCKFKETKKLPFCITTYMQKSTSPPMRYNPH